MTYYCARVLNAYGEVETFPLLLQGVHEKLRHYLLCTAERLHRAPILLQITSLEVPKSSYMLHIPSALSTTVRLGWKRRKHDGSHTAFRTDIQPEMYVIRSGIPGRGRC